MFSHKLEQESKLCDNCASKVPFVTDIYEM
jgi:hypothetical protein